MIDEDDAAPAALGTVVETERGSLPFALIHGEALLVAATWALGEAGVTPVDFTASWVSVQEARQPFVLHDALCPMVPPDFLGRCVATAIEREAVVVGVRPVTDTVKTLSDDGAYVGGTLDRDGLVSIASPIVLPAGVVAVLDRLPTTDFAELTATLASRFPVITLQAPPQGRRVSSPDDIRLLEALTRP